jgi:hypothetical protein
MSAARPTPEFQEYQFSFTGHIRDPESNKRPQGVPARRMAVYNDLVFNNIFGLVSPCFPVAQSILGVEKWKALMQEFLSSHRCRTPYFRQLPEEFLRFMQERESISDEPDFLIYLLHYEWAELALELSNNEPDACDIDAAGDLGKGRPVLTPVHMLLTYPYAVHRIGKDYRPMKAQREETCLLVFRDPSDTVRFIVLNAVSARLVGLIGPGDLTGNQAVEQVVSEINHPEPAVAKKGGHAIIENLRREGAILGSFTADPAPGKSTTSVVTK